MGMQPPTLDDLRIRGCAPFMGDADDGVIYGEQAYCLLLALARSFGENEGDFGVRALRGEIIGAALDGVASLVALSIHAQQPRE